MVAARVGVGFAVGGIDMRKIYLAGPIAGCTDEECKGWRNRIKEALGHLIQFKDPMDRDYRGVEGYNVRDIVEGDKRDIDECDTVIVFYTRPSVGTSMEILYAWERGKTVGIICSPGVTRSPWLEYHAHLWFTSTEDAIVVMRNWS